MNEQEDPKTLLRQRVILEHLSGRLTATQAALELGVSRKTFYEWLERALSAMRSALTDRPGGRPAKALDPEKDQLREEVAILYGVWVAYEILAWLMGKRKPAAFIAFGRLFRERVLKKSV